jgi:hypothetical protein
MFEIARVVEEVASRLETAERLAAIKQHLDVMCKDKCYGAIEVTMEELFEVCTFMKGVHGSLIFFYL